jgi:MOSC domain-containing protein YiiM
MRLRSLQIALPAPTMAGDQTLTTAFRKQAVEGTIHLGIEGLAGDGVGNPWVHGGRDKAVCAYPFEHYGRWEVELGVVLGVAAFGENFTTEGLTEETVHIGDRFRVGGAVVEVTQPRQPCATLAAIWGRKGLVKEVQASGRTGFYLRVVEEGEVAAGDPIALVAPDPAALTVAEAHRIRRAGRQDPSGVARLLAVAALSQAWRTELEKALRG